MSVDSFKRTTSNWLRYVNCARTSSEMNLEAFQYKRNIYYVTRFDIKSNTELMVWYGDEYGKELGISLPCYNGISMLAAQEETCHNQESPPANHLLSETVRTSEIKNHIPKILVKILSVADTTQSVAKNDLQDDTKKLSKSQSELEHLFITARLEPGKNDTAEVVYVNSENSKFGDCGTADVTATKQKFGKMKLASSLSNVRLVPKYNKYNHAYCVECRKTYRGMCPKHLMTLILDTPVARDGSVNDRAHLTTPWPLYVAKSKVKGAGKGIWTSATLPQGLVFGPCEGHIIKNNQKISGYGWTIHGRSDIEIDAEDTSLSNWVRFINCARNYKERNLVAMQIQNEIFYVTNCTINRDTELMVWYGAAYGKLLGISQKDFYKPQLKEVDLQRWCSRCHILFTSRKYFLQHQSKCKNSTKVTVKGNDKTGNAATRQNLDRQQDWQVKRKVDTEPVETGKEEESNWTTHQSLETSPLSPSEGFTKSPSQNTRLSSSLYNYVIPNKSSNHNMRPKKFSDHCVTLNRAVENDANHNFSHDLSITSGRSSDNDAGPINPSDHGTSSNSSSDYGNSPGNSIYLDSSASKPSDQDAHHINSTYHSAIPNRSFDCSNSPNRSFDCSNSPNRSIDCSNSPNRSSDHSNNFSGNNTSVSHSSDHGIHLGNYPDCGSCASMSSASPKKFTDNEANADGLNDHDTNANSLNNQGANANSLNDHDSNANSLNDHDANANSLNDDDSNANSLNGHDANANSLNDDATPSNFSDLDDSCNKPSDHDASPNRPSHHSTNFSRPSHGVSCERSSNHSDTSSISSGHGASPSRSHKDAFPNRVSDVIDSSNRSFNHGSVPNSSFDHVTSTNMSSYDTNPKKFSDDIANLDRSFNHGTNLKRPYGCGTNPSSGSNNIAKSNKFFDHGVGSNNSFYLDANPSRSSHKGNAICLSLGAGRFVKLDCSHSNTSGKGTSLKRCTNYVDNPNRPSDHVANYTSPSYHGVIPNTFSNHDVTPKRFLSHGACSKMFTDPNACPKRPSEWGVGPSRPTDQGACPSGFLNQRANSNGSSDQGFSPNESSGQGVSSNRSHDQEVSCNRSSDQGVRPNRSSDQGVTPDRSSNHRVGFNRYSLQRQSPSRSSDQGIRLPDCDYLKRSPNCSVGPSKSLDYGVSFNMSSEIGISPSSPCDWGVSASSPSDQQVNPKRSSDQGVSPNVFSDQVSPKGFCYQGISPNRSYDHGVSHNSTDDQLVSSKMSSNQGAGLNRSSDKEVNSNRRSDHGLSPSKCPDWRISLLDHDYFKRSPNYGVGPSKFLDLDASSNMSVEVRFSPSRSSDQGVTPNRSYDWGLSPNRPSDQGVSPNRLFDMGITLKRSSNQGASPSVSSDQEVSSSRSSNPGVSLNRSSDQGIDSSMCTDYGVTPCKSSDQIRPYRSPDHDYSKRFSEGGVNHNRSSECGVGLSGLNDFRSSPRRPSKSSDYDATPNRTCDGDINSNNLCDCGVRHKSSHHRISSHSLFNHYDGPSSSLDNYVNPKKSPDLFRTLNRSSHHTVYCSRLIDQGATFSKSSDPCGSSKRSLESVNPSTSSDSCVTGYYDYNVCPQIPQLVSSNKSSSRRMSLGSPSNICVSAYGSTVHSTSHDCGVGNHSIVPTNSKDHVVKPCRSSDHTLSPNRFSYHTDRSNRTSSYINSRTLDDAVNPSKSSYTDRPKRSSYHSDTKGSSDHFSRTRLGMTDNSVIPKRFSTHAVCASRSSDKPASPNSSSNNPVSLSGSLDHISSPCMSLDHVTSPSTSSDHVGGTICSPKYAGSCIRFTDQVGSPSRFPDKVIKPSGSSDHIFHATISVNEFSDVCNNASKSCNNVSPTETPYNVITGMSNGHKVSRSKSSEQPPDLDMLSDQCGSLDVSFCNNGSPTSSSHHSASPGSSLYHSTSSFNDSVIPNRSSNCNSPNWSSDRSRSRNCSIQYDKPLNHIRSAYSSTGDEPRSMQYLNRTQNDDLSDQGTSTEENINCDRDSSVSNSSTIFSRLQESCQPSRNEKIHLINICNAQGYVANQGYTKKQRYNGGGLYSSSKHSMKENKSYFHYDREGIKSQCCVNDNGPLRESNTNSSTHGQLHGKSFQDFTTCLLKREESFLSAERKTACFSSCKNIHINKSHCQHRGVSDHGVVKEPFVKGVCKVNVVTHDTSGENSEPFFYQLSLSKKNMNKGTGHARVKEQDSRQAGSAYGNRNRCKCYATPCNITEFVPCRVAQLEESKTEQEVTASRKSNNLKHVRAIASCARILPYVKVKKPNLVSSRHFVKNEDVIFKCSKCGRKFLNEYNYNVHDALLHPH